MDASRGRIPTGLALALGLGLLATSFANPAAAATCTLIAPPVIYVGAPAGIIGSGFPPAASVDIKLSVNTGAPDEFTVQSNSSGGFQISLTPEAGESGTTTVVATAGATCSARVAFIVLEASETAPSTTRPSSGPSAAPTTASPAAPNGSVASDTSSAPETDAASAPGGGTADPPLNAWAAAVLVLIIGMFGLLATRPRRSR